MNHTVYLKLSQTTELTRKDVVLRDVVQTYYDDQDVMNKCNSMKVMTVEVGAKRHHIIDALDIIDKLEQLDFTTDVNSVGEMDFIIAHRPPSPPAYTRRWAKTIFICLMCFFGAILAIMTLNDGVSVADVFSEVFKLVMGYKFGGFTMLEVNYLTGLAAGIIGFFNHFAAIKPSMDLMPSEVEMRLYEDSISKTLIANDNREESKIDIT